MTRARTLAEQDRIREVQRLEKFLESTGIKLSDRARVSWASPSGRCSRRSSTVSETHFTKKDLARANIIAIRRLQALGYNVALTTREAA